jgi:peroxiredoxin
LGVHIVGASFDDPARNQAWAESEGFSFELWSDTDRELALYYGAASSPSAFAASRVTKVIDPDGVLVLEYVSGLSVGTHPAAVLDDMRILFGP